MRIIVFICSFFFVLGLFAQQNPVLKGKVTEQNSEALVGANVYWLGTNIGGSSDVNGLFEIEESAKSRTLIISFTGFVNDTILIQNQSFVEVVLQSSVELNEVEVAARVKTTSINFMDPIKVETIGEEELCKAACCNLSESFETNPSVDASFTDAVTGTRQIQMLGLAGPYTQITRENIPDIRGLSAIYGLEYTPGPWVESISLIKGTGTVVNGYESIAGQIDVSLRKPQTMDRLYVNLFANQDGRLEANVNLKTDLNDKWSTALLLHAKNNYNRHDKNEDGFLDMPLGHSLIALNRWNYNYNGVVWDFGVKATMIDHIGGQNNFYKSDIGSNEIWGMHTNTKRVEAWSKSGFVFANHPNKSMGLQLSGIYHDFTSDFGLREYDAKQQSFYANYIFQNTLENDAHMYKIGASFVYDDYQQSLAQTPFNHTEIIPGAFAEYTYNWEERLNIVAGLRGDYHNHYGFFMTPRLHMRYLLTDDLVIRASAGRGQRTAQIISENIGVLASNRAVLVSAVDNDKPYGLDAEVAWNYGVNLSYEFELDYRTAVISFDVYRTQFENQIIVDLDSDVRQVQFYNLSGNSFSNSLQAQFDYELINRFDVRLAYRWYDVKATYGGELMDKPFVSTHRAFANLAYETRNSWKFDATLNWQGQKRLPSTMDNPVEYQRASQSPDFYLLNAQITKVWNDKLDIYLGIENILDYKQNDPIVAADQPFRENFDASMVWGPVFGRNIYIGLRYRIK
ncbi:MULTISPECIES: TonB-dependent receptor [unclassified Lentimicrobium]|uniref:TonB-dependent receptor n=1 Tax=unclassified Lentimicrobium TaxID=2677434 RepID=UPI001553306F|nr:MULTISPECIES: TonB-dependent receptor [unclassified Lentimicrobium]NPD44720.1 TonB-dependent receptor [Lentimicrobium sp. S6]NPD83424.1 TonB-dependent receptor [Lentimicrobium sp. L6]